MPVVPADYEDLVRLIGRRIPKDELVARVPMIGGAYEGEEEGRLHFEFFPNRPDLFSVEGLARACRAFFDVQPGLQTYPVEPSGETVTVDPSVTRIRPVLGFARVEGVPFTEDLLTQVIEIQERLTTGPGRRRKKVAIGIHDAARVKSPFTYKAVGWEEISFVPLGMDRALTPKQILAEHEKGRLYRHLVEGLRRVPLIVDRDGQVLSLPPIINGELTALTTRTRDVLVDVTGTDSRAVLGLLNIVTTALAERGGRIRTLDLVQDKGRALTPNLTPQVTKFGHARIRELLGLDLSPQEIAQCLGRLGHEASPVTPKQSLVRSPAWRLDLLHPDDIVEDVGIGYGFDRFVPRLPEVAQFGGLHATTRTTRRVRSLLLGLGFTEVVTLTVTGKRDAFEAVHANPTGVVEVLNALTAEQSILRTQLLPSLLGILRANKHRELPQGIFEVGLVVPSVASDASPRNELHAGALRIASRATFAEAKGLVEAFLRDGGFRASIVPGTVPGFIPGRCALLEREGRPVGFFGEVHPETLEAFELGAPALGFEVNLTTLLGEATPQG